MVDVVIKLPDDYASRMASLWNWDFDIREAIKNVVPLPKGHGRLIDSEPIYNALTENAEHYQEEFLKKSTAVHEAAMCGRMFGFTSAKFMIADAPTIIEADREDKDAVSN